MALFIRNDSLILIYNSILYTLMKLTFYATWLMLYFMQITG